MDFRLFGKMPSSNDMLHIFAIVSAKSGSSCLMSHIGAGSSRQCFEGEAPIILEISSADTGLNPDRVEICLGSITGGMTPDVARRILSILVWKKSANSSAENVLSDVSIIPISPSRKFLVPVTITSDLSRLSARLFSENHPWTARKQLNNVLLSRSLM